LSCSVSSPLAVENSKNSSICQFLDVDSV